MDGKKKAYWLVVGAAAGLINGLLGTGGGLVVLLGVLRAKEPQAGAHAAATACALLFTLLSAATYTGAGRADAMLLVAVVPGMALGGYLGSKLLGRLPGRTLKLLLGASLAASGALMILF
ncbi:MAG: TSUP family transporter [Christensenellales bacterium]|nr:TSUP family transporter [Clostridiales bacterium]